MLWVPPQEQHHRCISKPPDSLLPADPHLPHLLVVIESEVTKAVLGVRAKMLNWNGFVARAPAQLLECRCADMTQLLEYSLVGRTLDAVKWPRSVMIDASEAK